MKSFRNLVRVVAIRRIVTAVIDHSLDAFEEIKSSLALGDFGIGPKLVKFNLMIKFRNAFDACVQPHVECVRDV